MTPTLTQILGKLQHVVEMGGAVVAVLMAASVLTVALSLYKLWQFRAAGVGRHDAIRLGLDAWDKGDASGARRGLSRSNNHLSALLLRAATAEAIPDDRLAERLDAEAEERLSTLERGLPLLDMIAQLAPLLGLFGTVLGMIDAFRALQEAGSQVDPSILAGGIWVALMTTAAGLAVAMPTSLILSGLEARMRRERVFAETALRRALSPARQDAPQVAADA